jgi:hypothetical protein
MKETLASSLFVRYSKIFLSKSPYRLSKRFKHDFFAATALYEIENNTDSAEAPKKIVLKMYRHQHLFGIPMKWLGKFLCKHEVSILRRLNHSVVSYGRKINITGGTINLLHPRAGLLCHLDRFGDELRSFLSDDISVVVGAVVIDFKIL